MEQKTIDLLRRLGKTEEQIEDIIAHTNAYNEMDKTIWVKDLSKDTKRLIIRDTFYNTEDNRETIICRLARMFNAHCVDVFDFLWEVCNWQDIVIDDEEYWRESIY